MSNILFYSPTHIAYDWTIIPLFVTCPKSRPYFEIIPMSCVYVFIISQGNQGHLDSNKETMFISLMKIKKIY